MNGCTVSICQNGHLNMYCDKSCMKNCTGGQLVFDYENCECKTPVKEDEMCISWETADPSDPSADGQYNGGYFGFTAYNDHDEIIHNEPIQSLDIGESKNVCFTDHVDAVF